MTGKHAGASKAKPRDLTPRERKDLCPLHGDDPDDRLGYVGWHEKAAERGKAGEKQRQCYGCGLFIWERLFIA